MKIVAFLQNPWFQPGTADIWIEKYRDDQAYHRRVLGMSMSGRRLRDAFQELYDEIWWDNTSWHPADVATGKVPPDYPHMAMVIKKQEWNIVLAFGTQARDALRVFLDSSRVMCCHHPNARHKTQQDLDDFATLVRAKILEIELVGSGRHTTTDEAMHES